MLFVIKSFFRILFSLFVIISVLIAGNFVWANAFGGFVESTDSVSSVNSSSPKVIIHDSFDQNSNPKSLLDLGNLLTPKKPEPPKYFIDPKLVKQKVDLPILMYHHIDTIPKGLEKDKVGISLRVNPEVFDRQIKALKELGYNSINSFELGRYLEGSFELPQNPIMLTFDDGYKDNYNNALPILQKYGFKGDFGIITSVIGTGEYMDWNNLKQLLESGMSISSHTVSHCTLAVKNLKDRTQFLASKEDDSQKPCKGFVVEEKLTTGQIRYELLESKKILESKLGVKIPHLIYPLGNYNSQVMKIAQEIGYKFATTVRPQNDGITDFKDAFELRRIRVGGQQSGALNIFFTSK
jgi:peptidoglycan/xylan/chitin deacetylase (PgdA/CDA1 family)